MWTRSSLRSRAPARRCARPSCRKTRPRRRSGERAPFLYLRLRRHDYTASDLADWAARLEPFVADGLDAFVFFRHDETGRGAELALEFAGLGRGGH
jgi:uncharacterized protein YecE (DUF72 family)